MKKFARVLLIVECFVFLLIFAKDLESLIAYNPVFVQKHTTEEWIWFFVAEVLPLASVIVATVYSFLHNKKNGYLLAIAVGLYGVFLMISEAFRVHSRYVSVPPVVAAMALAVFLACIFFHKVPYRKKIAAAAMAVLAVGLLVAHIIAGGISNLMDWGWIYVPPVLIFALLGYILPDK